jgi:SAM-dependent methyltransferase
MLRSTHEGMSDVTPRLSFDRLAAIFDDQRSLPPSAVEAMHGVFGELVDDGLRSLIEPGAGTGRIAIPALAAGFRVTALDISPPMLAVLESRLAAVPEIAEQCEVAVGDATTLCFDDATFDVGVLAQVLYLIPEWRSALDELTRVVRPGGRIVLVQERTTMTHVLRQWAAAWIEATTRVGNDVLPQEPKDVVAATALSERVGAVSERVLATWSFGQPVGKAIDGLDRMRPLYESLCDDAWDAALAIFRDWRVSSGLVDDAWLGGTVALTFVSGIVPVSR